MCLVFFITTRLSLYNIKWKEIKFDNYYADNNRFEVQIIFNNIIAQLNQKLLSFQEYKNWTKKKNNNN